MQAVTITKRKVPSDKLTALFEPCHAYRFPTHFLFKYIPNFCFRGYV